MHTSVIRPLETPPVVSTSIIAKIVSLIASIFYVLSEILKILGAPLNLFFLCTS
jgi:hypothetical protein